MLTNYHTHTTRCGHAEGTEEEYILTALRCGFKVLGFSDHTPWAYATPGFVSRIRMLPSQLDDYVLTLRGLREKYADKLHIRIGLEAEYFPAYLGWLREEMERLDIEYLILGCHYDTTDEQDARASRFGGSTSTAHGRRYAEQVVEALETGLYRYLAHPDLFLNRVTAFDADAEKACRDICAAAARLDIPLEYNMAGLTLQDRPDGSLGYTRDEFWHIAAEYPVKAIVGCDAHAPSELDGGISVFIRFHQKVLPIIIRPCFVCSIRIYHLFLPAQFVIFCIGSYIPITVLIGLQTSHIIIGIDFCPVARCIGLGIGRIIVVSISNIRGHCICAIFLRFTCKHSRIVIGKTGFLFQLIIFAGNFYPYIFFSNSFPVARRYICIPDGSVRILFILHFCRHIIAGIITIKGSVFIFAR